MGRFRIRAVSELTAPFQVCLFDSSAYLQNYTEDSMEHFRVMTKLRMLSTFVCLAAVSSGQRQPITCALRAWFLGRFRTLAPLPIGCTPVGFASWMGYAAVNVNQSPARFALGSWDVFAYDLLPNRLSPLGQVSRSSPRHISTGRLHALRRFHSPPINLIVFEAPYRITP